MSIMKNCFSCAHSHGPYEFLHCEELGGLVFPERCCNGYQPDPRFEEDTLQVSRERAVYAMREISQQRDLQFLEEQKGKEQ